MIGVVGGGETAERVARQLEDDGESVLHEQADAVVERGPTAVVAVGEASIVRLVRAGVDAPVIGVETDPGVPSVSAGDVSGTVEQLADDDCRIRELPLLAASSDGDPLGPAVFDAMLVRTEPGRISEFGVGAAHGHSRFRADGVVVATPAGSHGYAAAAGGPHLALDASAVTAVPVAPFGFGAPSFVFDPVDGIELTVERDEGDVSVLLDGQERRRLSGVATVTLASAGVLRSVEPAVD